MSITVSELFTELNDAGLTLRRGENGTVAIVGVLANVTEGMQSAVQANLPALLECLPDPRLVAQKRADAIRGHLETYRREIETTYGWVQFSPELFADNEERIAEAVKTERPQVVANTVEAILDELYRYAYAARAFPHPDEDLELSQNS